MVQGVLALCDPLLLGRVRTERMRSAITFPVSMARADNSW